VTYLVFLRYLPHSYTIGVFQFEAGFWFNKTKYQTEMAFQQLGQPNHTQTDALGRLAPPQGRGVGKYEG
jgi:hypothetical protein